MNKILSFALLCSAALSFTACVSEEDDLFDKSAAERLNEASALYSSRLTASPNGWAVQLYPTTQNEAPYGTGYLLLFRFNADKSVVASMNNSLSDNKYMEDTSTWDVITDNGPVLSFNTYNKVVHTFSDPEDVPSTGTDTNPNDETGTGIGGDYEFIIVDAPEDASYMMLKGKKRGTYNLLTPIEEGVNYESYLADVKAFQNKTFPADVPTFDVLHAGDVLYKIEDANDGIPNIYEYDKDAVLDESFNPMLITKLGNDYYLRFRDKKTYGEYTVQEFKYDAEKDAFVSVDNDACYICGDDPLRFFTQQLCKKDYRWQWNRSSTMSEAYNAAYTALSTKMTASKYTLSQMQLVIPKDLESENKKEITTGDFIYRVTYSYNRRNYNVDYNFTWTKSDGKLVCSYAGTDTDSGRLLLQAFPELQSLLDVVTGDVYVSAGESGFNLNNIRLTSGNNQNMWFNITMKN